MHLSSSAVVAAVLFLGIVLPSAAQVQIIRQDVHHDVSPALRELVSTAPALPVAEPHEAEAVKLITLPDGFKPAAEPDSVQQQTAMAAPTGLAPAVINNFDGLGLDVPAGFVPCCAPPDTNGAVGLTQYVQWVNLSFAVFDKQTTNLVLGPVRGNTLWAGFGGPCETLNDGDPIVVYDKAADRWVLSQFAVPFAGPFLQCVAVSTTSDATGTYNRYSFSYSNFDDYPKMGVWPDAYYVTFNMFIGGIILAGADVCAYDRNSMLNGQPATQVCFQQGPTVTSLLPSDLDGHTPPPAGSPNFVMNFGVNSLNLYKFHADFTTPANSTFTGPLNIPVAPFTPLCNGGRGCVPQSGDGTQLDSLADRLMYRLAYRNFGDHESLVVNHTVAVGLNSGVRWYEIQNPNGTPAVAQQSTFAPDSNFRWMGSIAMDSTGDIALGYSVSGLDIFPSIAFTGRTPADPASTMAAETTLMTGAGAQTGGLTRWGDYSAMQVDPVDDCTFWYTTEYLKNSGSFNWNTRIANFRFPGCNLPDLAPTVSHTGNFTQGQNGATFTINVRNVGGKSTAGTVTVTDTLPAKITATAAAGTGWTCVLGPPVSCTRSDVLAPEASYPAITLTVNVAADAPGLVTSTATVSGGGDQNPANDTSSDQVKVIQLGPDPAIAKTHVGNFTQGLTGSYTITVTNTGLSATNGTPITVTDAVPAGLLATGAGGTGWNCVVSAAVSCTRSDVLASNAAYPPITVTVSVAANAPATVSNTASVGGGGDTNTLNNTAVDLTTVLPAPSDLTITKTHTGNFNQGQAGAAYTLSVSNRGTAPTSSLVIVTDTLPAGLTGTSISGPGWSCNLAALTCLRDSVLGPRATYPPITVLVTVAPGAPATLTNTATVSGGGDITPANNTANDPTTINPAPDLSITNSPTPSSFQVGLTALYTLTVNNVGHAPTVGTVTVSDSLPPGQTVLNIVRADGWSCGTLPTTVLTCTRADTLAAGGSYPLILLTVSVDGGGPVQVNAARVSGGGEFNTANNTGAAVVPIAAPILSIAISHTPEPFAVGQSGTYTINVGDTGTVAVIPRTVSVSDFLPQGMVATAFSGAGWVCPGQPTTFVTCTRIDSIFPGQSFPPLVLTVFVNSAPPLVTNTATVTGGGDTLRHSASDLTNVSGPVLAITKTHTDPFTVGQPGAYTITVSNTGKLATIGAVSVTDLMPQGMTATAVSGTGWLCLGPPLPSPNFSCSRTDVLAPLQSYPPLTVTVSLGNVAATVTNTASVSGGGDGVTHSAADITNINGPVLAITKTHPPGPFTVGQTGTYTLTVSNTGKVATIGQVNLFDSLPQGMNPIAASGAGWACSLPPGVVPSCTRADALAPLQSYPPLALTVSIDSAAASVVNSAGVSGGGDGVVHIATDPTSVNAPALAITKTHTGDFTAGQPGAYTITVSNTGAVATVGTVVMTDSLPNGMTGIAVTGAGWSCPAAPSTTVTCTRSDALATGSSYPPIVLTVNVGNVLSPVINRASVSGGGDSLTHSASDPTVVNAPVLAITKTHTGNFTVGQPGVYTITVSNTGTVATTGTVTVTDSLPFGLTATAVSGAGWLCSPVPTTFLSCTRFDSLLPKQSYPALGLTVSINGSASTVVNFATVTGGGDGASHSASDITIVATPTLAIAMSHTPPAPLNLGQTGTYTVTVSNTGTVATNGQVNVFGNLPTGLVYTAITAPGWTCTPVPSTAFSCSRADSLTAGGSYPPFSLSFILQSGNGLSRVNNTITVNGGGDSSQPSISDSIDLNVPVLLVGLSHSPEPLVAGQPGSYTINVGNAGFFASTSGLVSVNDFLPPNLTSTTVTGFGWTCTGGGTSSVNCTRSDSLTVGNLYPPITVALNVAGSGPITNHVNVSGGGDGQFHDTSDFTNIISPILSLTKSHTPDPFIVGQTGTYTLTVKNTGILATLGTVTLTDSLPGGLTATAISGTGWTCSVPPTTFVNCTRADSLAPGASFPSVTVTVSVGGGGPSVINQAQVSGGGAQNVFANDLTGITAPVLAIAMSHPSNFIVGQPSSYTITVSNAGTVATTGTVSVSDFLPNGLTATAVSGTGWTCSGPPNSFADCSRTDALAPASAYPPITLTIGVAGGGPAVTNSAVVSGGGDSLSHSALDFTIVSAPTLTITKSHTGDFTVGLPGTYNITVTNTSAIATVSPVNVSDFLPPGLTATAINALGWNCSLPPTTFVSCSRSDALAAAASYPPIAVTVSLDSTVQTPFTNQVNMSGGGDSAGHSARDLTNLNFPDLAISLSHTGDFTAGQAGSYTITVTNLGAVATSGGTVTVDDFLPGGLTPTAASGTGWTCVLGITSAAMTCTRPAGVLLSDQSYPPITLSVTAAPVAPPSVTNIATVFGIGDANTGNNAAFDATVISGFRFVPVPPCRIADTRNPNGPFGGPFLAGNTSRGFAIPASACGIPATAQAYSLNVTVVPKGSLGFLTMFPCGQALPLASTLNSIDGRTKAGAAIIPAGTAGAVCAFPTNDTELVLDINGYFVPATDPAGMAFYPLAPCRVVDTRLANGPLAGPALAGNAARTFPVLTSSCNIPAAAKAYSFNYTSVPNGSLGFLTTWPAGQPQPLVSTLNAPTGTVTANAAIVPAGVNGDISVFVTNTSDLVIDVNGYFAPPAPGGLSLFPLTPCRVLDTRNPSGALPFNGSIDLDVVNAGCTAPASAQSFVLNATVVPPGPLGFLTLWPQGSPQPLVSTLNAQDGAITSNMAIVPTANGAVSAFGSNPVHLVLDITAFFAP